MPKNKRKSDSKNAVGEQDGRSKAKRGKRLRTALATPTICAAAFGAYYSPHFRAASSDWLERCRAFVAKASSSDVSPKANDAEEDEKMGEILAQAPSFRDFLAEEYGEEEARELLGIDAAPPVEPTFAEPEIVENVEQNAEAQEVAFDGETSFPSAEPTVGFADYVAAESATETLEAQEVGADVDALLNSPLPESGMSFADYVAAENGETEETAVSADAPLADEELEPSVDDGVDFKTDESALTDEKARLEPSVESAQTSEESEDETALAARLEAEMKERGVGNPRIERWGGRFWRASGVATTSDGVATFCEAVDVDPTAAQRAALAKFEAASF